MVNNTIETFTKWSEITDYDSDEASVTLINEAGEKVAEYGYSRFTKDDFDRFRTFNSTNQYTPLITLHDGKLF